ncbi:MAG: TonB-dependent receptor [Sulfuricella sp.]|nr:TonB-dependent receptor [Sulfuricella sp.]
MKVPFKILLPLSLLTLQSAGAVAQELEEEDLALAYGDKETVSIATGTKQLLRRAPSVTSVITAEDIKAMGATTLDEVMESVPGVHVTRSANAYFSLYSIRGIGSNPTVNPQVLMLQNSIPTNSAWRGDRGGSVGAPLLENIERIEIIRGPGSALYGADAFSGVINIITKNAETTPGTTVGARVGSFNAQNIWVQHGSRHGALDVAAYLQAGRSDGADQIIGADAATRLNKAFGGTSSLAPGPLNMGDQVIDAQLDLGYDKWRLRSGFKWHSAGTYAGTSYALDPNGTGETQRINADLSWNDTNLTQNWGLGFAANFLQQIEDTSYLLYPPGTIFPSYTVSAATPAGIQALLGPIGTVVPGTFTNGMLGSPARRERQFRLSANATYSGFSDHNIRLGAGHEDLNMYQVQSLKNFWLRTNGAAALIGVPIPTGALIDYSVLQPHQLPHRRFNDYVYVQDEWNLARDWALTAGVRSDNFSDFGTTTNPRLALVWDAGLDVTAKLLYGQAFRAPSFNEQYGVNPTGDGNPDIKPERIKTLEAAISWQARNSLKLNLNLYRYTMKDTIRAVTKPSGIGAQFTNTGQLHGSGMEVEAVWDAGRNLRVTANLALQESIDESTNSDAGYAPHKHAYARADWRMADNWMLSPQLNWVADRRRIKGDTRPPVPDYTTFDVTLHNTREKRQWNFAVAARNLFNATVLEPTLYVAAPGNLPAYPTAAIPGDLPVAPRSLWLQVTYKL